MDITIIKDSTATGKHGTFLKGIHWKNINYGWIDLTIYTETVQAAGHSSAKEAFARMMERQEGGRYEKNRENQCFVMWVTADRNLRNLRIAESLCPVSGKQWKSSEFIWKNIG